MLIYPSSSEILKTESKKQQHIFNSKVLNLQPKLEGTRGEKTELLIRPEKKLTDSSCVVYQKMCFFPTEYFAIVLYNKHFANSVEL